MSDKDQLGGVMLIVAELKLELADVKDQLRLMESDRNNFIERIEQLEFEVIKKHKAKVLHEPVNSDVAEKAFWSITPKQHAIMQLVMSKYTNVLIADRLKVTEGAVKSYVRQLCESLGVTGRNHLKIIYQPVLSKVGAKEYLEHTTIQKDWAIKYGVLSYEEASKKDPYFDAICNIRYRKPNKRKQSDVVFIKYLDSNN